MREFIQSNLQDLGINFHDKTHQQIDVNKLILAIERKMPKLAGRAFKIQQRLQKLYCLLQERIVKAVALKRINDEDVQEFCDYFQKNIQKDIRNY